MNKKIQIILSFVLVVFTTNALGQSVQKYKNAFQFDYGFYQYNKNEQTFLGNGVSFLSVGLGYQKQLLPFLDLGIKGKYFEQDYLALNTKQSANTAQASFVLHWPRVSHSYNRSLLTPYMGVGFGMGQHKIQVANVENTADYLFFPLTAGINLNLSNHWSLGANVEYRFSAPNFKNLISDNKGQLDIFNAISFQLGYHFRKNKTRPSAPVIYTRPMNIDQANTKSAANTKVEKAGQRQFSTEPSIERGREMEEVDQEVVQKQALPNAKFNSEQRIVNEIPDEKIKHGKDTKELDSLKLEIARLKNNDTILKDTVIQIQKSAITIEPSNTQTTITDEQIQLKEVQEELQLLKKEISTLRLQKASQDTVVFGRKTIKIDTVVNIKTVQSNPVISPIISLPIGEKSKEKIVDTIFIQSAKEISNDSLLTRIAIIQNELEMLNAKQTRIVAIDKPQSTPTKMAEEKAILERYLKTLEKQNQILQEELSRRESAQQLQETKEQSPKNYSVFFDINSSKVSAQYLGDLRLFFAQNQANKQQWYLLEGYADKSGNAAYNLLLSKKRVISVKIELLKLGVDKEKIIEKTFGSSLSNEAINSDDRKVVIRIVAPR